MIAYFDASAVVPLVLHEVGSQRAIDYWDEAERVMSVSVAHVEAHAALVRAERGRRISKAELRSFTGVLERVLETMSFIAVDDELIRTGVVIAQSTGLRAYDAVHLAAAMSLNDSDVVFVAGDRALLEAAAAVGLHTASTA